MRWREFCAEEKTTPAPAGTSPIKQHGGTAANRLAKEHTKSCSDLHFWSTRDIKQDSQTVCIMKMRACEELRCEQFSLKLGTVLSPEVCFVFGFLLLVRKASRFSRYFRCTKNCKTIDYILF